MTIQTKPVVSTLARSLLGAGLLAATFGLQAAPAQNYDQKVFALEHALIGVGYELNRVDGVMDPRTEKALRKYQESRPEVPVTGKVDSPTLRALGIRAGKMVASAAPQADTTAASGNSKNSPTTSAKPTAAVKPKTEAVEKAEDSGWLFF